MERNPKAGAPSRSLLERLDAAPPEPHVFNEALETVNGILEGKIDEPEMYQGDEGVLAVYPMGDGTVGLGYYEKDFEDAEDSFFSAPVEEFDKAGVVAYHHQAVRFLNKISSNAHKNQKMWRNVHDYN